MRKIIRFSAAIVLAMLMTSCLFKNDMSYPRVFAEFTSFEVKGANKVTINTNDKVISIELNELEELSAVKVKSYTYTEDATMDIDTLDVLDLTKPLKVNLRTYQDYIWTIQAVQPVERYVHVDHQVGEAKFNLSEHSVIVYVTSDQSLNKVQFNGAKFDRKGSKIVSTKGFYYDGDKVSEEVKDVKFPMTLDCVLEREFNVEYKDVITPWTVKVIQQRLDFSIEQANAWAYHADIQAIFNGKGTPILQYHQKGVADWYDVENVKVAGFGISAAINNLDMDTEYEVRVGDGEKWSDIVTFKTEEAVQLYNSDFEIWRAVKSGKQNIWYPFSESVNLDLPIDQQNHPERIWDSANKGSGSLVGSGTTPDETYRRSGKSVKMVSQYAAIAFAAGNIYTGKFNKIQGKGANLYWGVPFKNRPVALKGYYKYIPSMIEYYDKAHENLKGTMDRAQFQIMLTDWDKPFNIITSDNVFVDIENDPHIIAYSEFLSEPKATPGDDLIEFVLPVDYRDLTRKPTHIVVTCCSSYMGDFFTGGVGSTLWVDDLELVYE